MDPVDGEVPPPFFGLADELAPQPGPSRLGRLVDRLLDGFVSTRTFDETAGLHPVEQASLAADVVVLQVEQGDLGMGQWHVVALAVPLDEPVLDDPVALGVERERVLLIDEASDPADDLCVPIEPELVPGSKAALLEIRVQRLEVDGRGDDRVLALATDAQLQALCADIRGDGDQRVGAPRRDALQRDEREPARRRIIRRVTPPVNRVHGPRSQGRGREAPHDAGLGAVRVHDVAVEPSQQFSQ